MPEGEGYRPTVDGAAQAPTTSRASRSPLRGLAERVGLLSEKPTEQQLDRLRLMSRYVTESVLNGNYHPDDPVIAKMQRAPAMTEWVTRIHGRIDQQLRAVDQLYQVAAGDEALSFRRDFPSLTRQLRKAFTNTNMDDPEWGDAPGNLVRRIDEYVTAHTPQSQTPTTAK